MSTESLLASIQEELNTSPYTRQYKLKVRHADAVIFLTGTVSCWYHKQMANEAVRRVLQNTSSTTILFRNEIAVETEK